MGPRSTIRSLSTTRSSPPGSRFHPLVHNPQQQESERKVMNDTFDELAKGLAQSVTRRGALKKFSLGLAGIALATLGFPNRAEAEKGCSSHPVSCAIYACCCYLNNQHCIDLC